MKTLIYIFIIWNLFVFFLMGIDKRKAKKEKRRVPEKTLLICAFLFGAVGEILGGLVFHHKTRKKKFRICWPLAVLVNAGLIYLIIFLY